MSWWRVFYSVKLWSGLMFWRRLLTLQAAMPCQWDLTNIYRRNLLQERLRGGCVRSIVLTIQVPTQWQIRAHDALKQMNSNALFPERKAVLGKTGKELMASMLHIDRIIYFISNKLPSLLSCVNISNTYRCRN